jgi:hypothetical protein
MNKKESLIRQLIFEQIQDSEENKSSSADDNAYFICSIMLNDEERSNVVRFADSISRFLASPARETFDQNDIEYIENVGKALKSGLSDPELARRRDLDSVIGLAYDYAAVDSRNDIWKRIRVWIDENFSFLFEHEVYIRTPISGLARNLRMLAEGQESYAGISAHDGAKRNIRSLRFILQKIPRSTIETYVSCMRSASRFRKVNTTNIDAEYREKLSELIAEGPEGLMQAAELASVLE